MTDKKKPSHDRDSDSDSDDHQQGGLTQEESGGPGSNEKNENQRKDGQLEQDRENLREEQKR